MARYVKIVNRSNKSVSVLGGHTIKGYSSRDFLLHLVQEDKNRGNQLEILRKAGYIDVILEGDTLNSNETSKLEAPLSQEIDGLAVGGIVGIVLITPTIKKSYSTITAALADATDGNTVLVGPGTYRESVTVPQNVCLIGTCGAARTLLTGAAATGVRIQLSAGSGCAGFTVELPTDASPAIDNSTSGRAQFRASTLFGNGGSGIGVRNSGSGSTICFDVAFLTGDASIGFLCTAGQFYLNSSVIVAGTINHALEATGGQFNCSDVLIAPNVSDHSIHIENAEFRGNSIEIRDASTAIHVTHANANVHITGIRALATIGNVLLINDGLGDGPEITITGELDREKITYDASYSNVSLAYLDDTANEQSYVIDADLTIGRPELGRLSIFGEGESTARGLVVLTTDDTADATHDGGNLTDVSSNVSIKGDGLYAGFQGLTAGHSILFGSSLSGPSDKLKHWGLKISTLVARTGGAIQFEIWNGSAWVTYGTNSTHSTLFYRYCNATNFLRAPNTENLRYGLDSSSTWVKKSINGESTYWSRVRITSDLSQGPTFDQIKLSTSHSEMNPDGTITHHGIARWIGTRFVSGSFGDVGVSNATFTVGSGSGDETWTHLIPNARLATDNDRIFAQFSLPRGIDTSFPLRAIVSYRVHAAGSGTCSVSFAMKPIPKVGVLVADATGGIAPVPRSEANTALITTGAATVVNNVSLPTTTADKMYRVAFEPYPVDLYYEGDEMMFQFRLVEDGVPGADIDIVEGVMWTLGGKL